MGGEYNSNPNIAVEHEKDDKKNNVTITLSVVLGTVMVLFLVVALRYYHLGRNRGPKRKPSKHSMGPSERDSNDEPAACTRDVSSSTISTTRKQTEPFEENDIEVADPSHADDDSSESDHSTIKTMDASCLYIEDGVNNSTNVPAVDMTPSVYHKHQKQSHKPETTETNQKLLQMKERLKKERRETKSVISKLDGAIRICERRIELSKLHAKRLGDVSDDSQSVTTREALRKDITESNDKINRLEETIALYSKRLKETEAELRRFRKVNPSLVRESSWSTFPDTSSYLSPSDKKRRRSTRSNQT
jgi:hypothetical protein